VKEYIKKIKNYIKNLSSNKKRFIYFILCAICILIASQSIRPKQAPEAQNSLSTLCSTLKETIISTPNEKWVIPKLKSYGDFINNKIGIGYWGSVIINEQFKSTWVSDVCEMYDAKFRTDVEKKYKELMKQYQNEIYNGKEKEVKRALQELKLKEKK